MRAFVIEGPGRGAVRDVEEPRPGPGEVVVDVERVGLCGTDVELFAGSMPYIAEGLTRHPIRSGHEWAGTVRELGAGVTAFAPGDRVVGDTFLGCGRCERCRGGRHHLCPDRFELGVRGDRPGALAERMALPASALHRIPDELSFDEAALVEPGSCSLRGVRAAGVAEGSDILVWGAGTVGLLAAAFATMSGGLVSIVVRREAQARYIRSLGIAEPMLAEERGPRTFDAVIDATGSAEVPPLALRRVRPGGCLVLLGVPATPVGLDVARLVLDDITAVGVLGGSDRIDETIGLLASRDFESHRLISETVALDDVESVLSNGGRRPGQIGTKVQVDPQSRSD